MNDYKYRIADYLLEEQLEAAGAVLIQGPKWCGKTTTAALCANSVVYMDDPARKDIYLKMAETAPLICLKVLSQDSLTNGSLRRNYGMLQGLT